MGSRGTIALSIPRPLSFRDARFITAALLPPPPNGLPRVLPLSPSLSVSLFFPGGALVRGENPVPGMVLAPSRFFLPFFSFFFFLFFFFFYDAINFNIIAYCRSNWRKVRVTAPLGYRAPRDFTPPPSHTLLSILIFRVPSQTTILIPSINIFGLSGEKTWVRTGEGKGGCSRIAASRINERTKRSFIFRMKIYERRYERAQPARYFSKSRPISERV